MTKKINPDIKIRCGRARIAIESKDFKIFNFEADDMSAAREGVAADEFRNLMEDPDFGHAGQRNHDAVNLCCILHAYGVDDPRGWFEDFDAIVDFTIEDYKTMLDHIDRIVPYLEKWGPEGNRSEAICFMV